MVVSIFLVFLSVYSSVTSDNTTDYIHHLEQKISDLESHTQASEQKQAAVLASVLSQLQAQEQTIQELKDDRENTTTNLNSTYTTGNKQVAFEASTTFDAGSSPVPFQKVTSNDGGGYNATRGTFIAPTTGTYFFWFSGYVSMSTYRYPSNILVLQVEGSSYQGYASLADVIQSSSFMRPGIANILVQGQHAVSVKAGEAVSVKLMAAVSVKSGSTFGGMLLL